MKLKPPTPQLFDLCDEVTVRVWGLSMLPWLLPGDLLRVATAVKPKVGDIVVILRGTTPPLIHRLIAVSEKGVRTQGDSMMTPDSLVSTAQIGGVVISMRRFGLPWPLPPLRFARLATPVVHRLLSMRPQRRSIDD
ncbi:MAG: S24/S26 family peptidase [Myxococcota bacterium]|nr:S24/S26 family peptidase [Myxococcota bacterium]